jgi:hypothetical protein
MGAPQQSNTDPVAPRTADRPEMHNVSVDEFAAREGRCAQVHLPTGRMCAMPHAHNGSCEFISVEAAYASLRHGRRAASGTVTG